MYDITRDDSFSSIDIWLREVRQNSDPDVVVYLVGNMIDLADKRTVPISKGTEFAKANRLNGFTEASAKTAENVLSVRMYY